MKIEIMSIHSTKFYGRQREVKRGNRFLTAAGLCRGNIAIISYEAAFQKLFFYVKRKSFFVLTKLIYKLEINLRASQSFF